MKKLLTLFVVFISFHIHAQDYYSDHIGTIKIGGGYARDFPGLSGYGIAAEYSHSLSENLEGGFGLKRINMSGTPRTLSVEEFTKASTLDFNIYYIPLKNESNILRIGAGYTFSFYKTRRSYPVIETNGTEKITSWPMQDKQGRSSGVTLTAEYEYVILTNLSVGLKASLCKAYDRDFYVGPYLGIRF